MFCVNFKDKMSDRKIRKKNKRRKMVRTAPGNIGIGLCVGYQIIYIYKMFVVGMVRMLGFFVICICCHLRNNQSGLSYGWNYNILFDSTTFISSTKKKMPNFLCEKIKRMKNIIEKLKTCEPTDIFSSATFLLEKHRKRIKITLLKLKRAKYKTNT